MIKLGKIIRQLREIKGISQTKLAHKAGLSPQYLNCIEMENDNADNIGLQTIEKIAGALEIDTFELFARASGEIRRERRATIPILGSVNFLQKDKNSLVNSTGHPRVKPVGTVVRPPELVDDYAYAVTVGDTSMEPIVAGWLVIVSPKQTCRSQDLVVIEYGGQTLLRRFQIKNNLFIFDTLKSGPEMIVTDKRKVSFVHKVWSFRAPAE